MKKGPFFEHSPTLYDISAVPYWWKINKGMVKMYKAEVLGKFPVIQHFPIGRVFFPLDEATNTIPTKLPTKLVASQEKAPSMGGTLKPSPATPPEHTIQDYQAQFTVPEVQNFRRPQKRL
jgi:serine/threonine-protein phosphatase 2A activator